MALRLHSTRFSFALLSFTVRRTHSLCKKKHVGCPSCLIRHKSDVTLPRFQLYSFLCMSSFAAPAQLDAIFRVCRHSIFSPINPTPSGMPELFTVFSPHQPQETHQSDLNCYKCITRPCEVTMSYSPSRIVHYGLVPFTKRTTEPKDGSTDRQTDFNLGNAPSENRPATTESTALQTSTVQDQPAESPASRQHLYIYVCASIVSSDVGMQHPASVTHLRAARVRFQPCACSTFFVLLIQSEVF